MERLGGGAMGEVYRATDTTLGRAVALKVLSKSLLTSAEMWARFDVEARAVAALSHPNLVSLYDTGEQGGVPFLVYELIEGRTLQAIMKDGPLPAERAVRYVLATAACVGAAHEAGILHRDLKPANLMVGNDGRLRVLDFGLAKLDESYGGPPVTRQGLVVGTPEYMSPEQALAQPADPRSDIFSLGIVFYELLCAAHPFQGKGVFELLQSIIRDPPRPARSYFGDPLPAAYEAVLDRMLRKVPDQRYQTMRELSQDLERTLLTEERLSLTDDILRRVHALVIVMDEDGHLRYVNQAVKSLLGYRPADLVGDGFLSITYPDAVEREARREQIGRMARGEEPIPKSYEQMIAGADGRPRWLQWEGGYAPEGQIVGVGHDVTEKKRVETALRDSELKYRLLFDANPHPMLVHDLSTLRILAANQAACEAYGYRDDELRTLTVPDLEAQEEVPAIESTAQGVSRHRRKDGSILLADVTSHDLIFEGRPARIVLALDVTRREAAREELRDLSRVALFTAAVAHALAASQVLHESLHAVTDLIVRDLAATYATLYTLDDDERMLELRAASGRGGETPLARTRVSVGRFHVGRVADERAPLFEELDPGASVLNATQRSSMRFFVGHPLLVADRLVGVMGLYFAKAPAAAAREALAAVASEVALAVDRSRATAAEREIAERHQNLFETAPIGIYRATPDGRLLAANPALVRMLHYESFEEMAVAFEARPISREELHGRLERDGRILGLVSTWRRKDGTEVEVRENVVLCRDEHGGPRFHDGTVEDLS